MQITKLSTQFFNVIKSHYKYNKYVWPSMYDSFRYKKYGLIGSYDGHGQCGCVSKLLKDHIVSQKLFEDVSICKTVKSIEEATRNSLSCYDHVFLKVSNKSKNEFIVDGTYKQLFIQKRGPVDKCVSPYADYLYNLPPVFIGTYDDLFELMHDLQRIKSADPLHADDIFITDWYSGTNNNYYN
jgi:hypothetical protein